MKQFKSILEFKKHFDTNEKCTAFLEHQRWNGTPACPYCGTLKVTRLKDGKRFQCNESKCRNKFSVLVGSILENTKLPLTKWFLAMYILNNHSKGISSLQLSKWLGCTQKTAWFLNHRIREMLKENEPELLKGVVEVDETYIGGKISNKHNKVRKALTKDSNKTIVFGALEREGKVIAKVVKDAKKETLIPTIYGLIEKRAIMVTDENTAYHYLGECYYHIRVNHGAKQYVKGNAHTNSIEGFWSLLKRQINGIHHFVSPKHLQRYCDEAAHRYNNKRKTQDTRFCDALIKCEGRLKYKDLIKTNYDTQTVFIFNRHGAKDSSH